MSHTSPSDPPADILLNGTWFAVELVRQLVVPTFVLDARGRVIVWNRACELLTGMPAAEVIGTRDHWRAFYGEPRPCLADLIVEHRDAEIDALYAVHDPRQDTPFDTQAENWCVMPLRGTECYLAIDAGPIRDEAGTLIAVVETLRDLTARQRAESRLRLTASVFENSREGILITDPEARILDVNAAFTRVTGYARDEVLGQTPALLKSGLQDGAFYRALWRQLRETRQWQGEIWNRRKSGEIYPQILHINAVTNARDEVTQYIGMFIDISALKDSERRLENLASHDALTGLPNRARLGERLRQTLADARRDERLAAICALDLDHFTRIQERHGSVLGDRVLVEIARRLVGLVRASDTVARPGGDEFVILFGDLKNQDDLEECLCRLREHVARPIRIDDIDLSVTASIGVTLYPLDDSPPETLLRHADQALYQAKQAGRDRHLLFDAHSSSELQVQYRALERIRQALQHGEFRLHYQPKVNLRTGAVVGLEALIRWQHPERGLLGPGEFLPLVEHTPLDIAIGEWVLHEALAQMEIWAEAGLPLAVSVNIAAPHFQRPEFIARLRAILDEHPGVAPGLLELEILETAALEDIDLMRGVMGACHALGVSFALDDFGTGYCSLSYLKQLPAETLKIDQSFVRDMLEDPDDQAIIEGVIGLARAFRKQVIAEGVETLAHGRLLLRLGCDHAQGYGIARPMPAEQVPDWARTFRLDTTWESDG